MVGMGMIFDETYPTTDAELRKMPAQADEDDRRGSLV